MDRERLRLLGENIKIFLFSKTSRKALVFLFFVLISAGFWLLQTLNETYDTVLHLPLRLTDVPADVVVTTDLPEELQVTVRDKGTSLLRYSFGMDEVVSVNFRDYDEGQASGHAVIMHADVQKQLTSMLEPSSRILQLRPDTLEFFYTRGKQKRVPVAFRGNITTNPLYYLAEVSCSPDSVTVWAEERILDSLQVVYTATTVINDLKVTTTREVPLATQRGMKFEPAEVSMTALVDVYTEKQVEVPIIGTNFPGGHTLRTFPATAIVSFRVGARNFKNINAENFVLTATYEELLALPDSILQLHLRSVPEGVSQVRIQPESVQFLIEQSEDE